MSLTCSGRNKLIPIAATKKTLKLQQKSYNNFYFVFCFCYGRIMLNNSRTTLYFHG